MVGLSVVQNFITKTQRLTILDDVQTAFSEGIELLGFDKHTCMSLVDRNTSPQNRFWRYSYPNKWLTGDKNEDLFEGADLPENTIIRTPPYALPDHSTCRINMIEPKLSANSDHYHSLHLIAVSYHHNLIKILHGDEKDFNLPKLSPREKECLIWAAKGLSDHDISDLLAISSSTVTSYMKNVRAKFNVRTRIQVVAIAVFYGIIQP